MYPVGRYDLAGFAVGIVEKNQMLPKIDEVCVGDVVIGIPSSGIHSNGYSMVRRIVQDSCASFEQPAPFNPTRSLGKTGHPVEKINVGTSVRLFSFYWNKISKVFYLNTILYEFSAEELLTPTKIYVKSLLPVLRSELFASIRGMAHITGGGLLENTPRILPKSMDVQLDAGTWPVLPVFSWLSFQGKVAAHEMARTFNMGIGMVLIVKQDAANAVMDAVEKTGEVALKIGMYRGTTPPFK